jgi:hypothetical protein
MQLNPHVRHTAQFTCSKERKSFSAEASDLGFRAGQEPFGRLYDDACDVGITLDNLETGNRTHWYLPQDQPEVDGEGDIKCWVFKPTSETLRAHPKLAGWTVTVFND